MRIDYEPFRLRPVADHWLIGERIGPGKRNLCKLAVNNTRHQPHQGKGEAQRRRKRMEARDADS